MCECFKCDNARYNVLYLLLQLYIELQKIEDHSTCVCGWDAQIDFLTIIIGQNLQSEDCD